MASTSEYKVEKITDIYVDGSGIFPEKIEKKLSTISWASQIEEEFGDSLVDELLVSSSCSSNDSDTDVDSNGTENLVLDFDECSIEELHQNLFTVATDLKKSVKSYIDSRYSDKFTIEDFKDRLTWVKDLIDFFSDKLKMKQIVHSGTKCNAIPRSSYKFCDFGKDCHYNYNHKKFTGCFAQHFVYNYLSADINSLINYLEVNKDKKLKYIEILTCMNTICYVINHMKDEYLGILSYYPVDIDQMYQERTPQEKKKHRKQIS